MYFVGRYIYILSFEMASPVNQHCANSMIISAHFRSLLPFPVPSSHFFLFPPFTFSLPFVFLSCYPRLLPFYYVSPLLASNLLHFLFPVSFYMPSHPFLIFPWKVHRGNEGRVTAYGIASARRVGAIFSVVLVVVVVVVFYS